MPKQLPATRFSGHPITALAPMQDVTTLPFMNVIAQCGAPDYFVTEYFRVHEHSILEKHILQSITENATGRPVFAQFIGEDVVHIKRTVEALLPHPIAGIDINMGCPAPKVYKKNVGGGLLRNVEKVDELLGELRAACTGLFTVKMRIGFDSTENFEPLLELINKHQVDMLSLHGRTVKEMYRSDVHYEYIKQAAETVNCPVLANGNVTSVEKALWVLEYTGCAGVMIGRSAIRNPWIFRQFHEHFLGEEVYQPKRSDVREYVDLLYKATATPTLPDLNHVARMKKFLNFVGQGVDPEGQFLHRMRRTRTSDELFTVCDDFMAGSQADIPFATEPHPNLIARPSREKPLEANAKK